MSELDNRVALVTGAGMGIGRAIALRLAEAGAFVGVHFCASEQQAKVTLAQVVAMEFYCRPISRMRRRRQR